MSSSICNRRCLNVVLVEGNCAAYIMEGTFGVAMCTYITPVSSAHYDWDAVSAKRCCEDVGEVVDMSGAAACQSDM